MENPTGRNCIDIVRPYIELVTREGMFPVQLLGGVGSVALANQATVINVDDRRIIAPSDLYLDQYRDDGNLRDVETLVLSTSKADEVEAKICADLTIGTDLITETFPILDNSKVDGMIDHPLGMKAMSTFLSDRYMEPNTEWSSSSDLRRVLFPFSVPITPEAIESWTLEIDGQFEIPVPSPGATIINYLTRSVSGLRGKDAEKVQKMGRTIFTKAPDLVDWIVDGPGGEQFEMARILHTLREPKRSPQALIIGNRLVVDVLKLGDLTGHEAFLLDEENRITQIAALKVARAKSRALHFAESFGFVVTPFQKYVEPRIHSLIHND